MNATSRCKISVFIPTLFGGGAERVTVYLANGLAERGWPVDLVLVQPAGPWLAGVSDKLQVVDLHATRALRAVFPLARYLRRQRPAILLSALEHGSVTACLARRLAGVATSFVPTSHSTLSEVLRERHGMRNLMVSCTISWCYRQADAVVAVSHSVAEDMIRTARLRAERVRTIYPILTPNLREMAREPVDHPWFAAGQPGVILAVGGLHPRKDFPTLLRAFAMVHQHVGHRLVILGEGAQRPELEALARELGVADRLAMPGYSKNVFAYMARCSLFVLSSLAEAMPMVITEALAVGTPVVATDCRSGPREILHDGEYGRLVPVGDAEKLAEAILQALSEPRRQLPEEFFQPFSADTVVDQHLRLFEELREA